MLLPIALVFWLLDVFLQLGLEEICGNEDVDGEIVKTEVGKKTYFVEEVDEEKRPFRCLLDVGIKATTTGSKVFAALKVLRWWSRYPTQREKIPWVYT